MDLIKSFFELRVSIISPPKSKTTEGYLATISGKTFFSNAELGKTEQKEITKELSTHLYKNIASTKIDKNGIAKKSSLRTMEVCIPVTLLGEIIIEEENAEYIDIFEKAFKWTRYIGVNRNRGLGRCKFLIEKN